MGTPEAGPGPDRDGGGAAPRPQVPPGMPPVPAGALAHGRAAALRCVGSPGDANPEPGWPAEEGEGTRGEGTRELTRARRTAPAGER